MPCTNCILWSHCFTATSLSMSYLMLLKSQCTRSLLRYSDMFPCNTKPSDVGFTVLPHCQNAKTTEAHTLEPNTTHAARTLLSLVMNNARSKLRCFSPLKKWYVNGMETPNFSATFAAGCREPNAVTTVAVSTGRPSEGPTRYRVANPYRLPDSIMPVTRCRMDARDLYCHL